MSLEMLANPDYVLDKTDMTTLEEALRILGRCGVADTNVVADRIRDGRQACLPDWAKPQPDPLFKKVVGSLEFAICNPECEMERPSEWIGNDPDSGQLPGGLNDCFMAFLDDQWKRDYPFGG
jgi:hypothetical protein